MSECVRGVDVVDGQKVRPKVQYPAQCNSCPGKTAQGSRRDMYDRYMDQEGRERGRVNGPECNPELLNPGKPCNGLCMYRATRAGRHTHTLFLSLVQVPVQVVRSRWSVGAHTHMHTADTGGGQEELGKDGGGRVVSCYVYIYNHHTRHWDYRSGTLGRVSPRTSDVPALDESTRTRSRTLDVHVHRGGRQGSLVLWMWVAGQSNLVLVGEDGVLRERERGREEEAERDSLSPPQVHSHTHTPTHTHTPSSEVFSSPREDLSRTKIMLLKNKKAALPLSCLNVRNAVA